MNRKAMSVCATAVAAALASHLQAAEVQWKGGSGTLVDVNYTLDGVDTRPVASGDILNLGANGIVTTPGTGVPGRVRVGHNFTTFTNLDGSTGGASTLTGPATLSVTGGTLALGGNGTAGTYAGTRAGLVVGYNADGTFNHQGGITQVTENVVIGADNPDDTFTGTGTGTLNISGGTFRVRRNDMLVGYGNPGAVTISAGGNLNVLSNTLTHNENIDLYVGFTTASTLTKPGAGFLLVNNNFLIGSGSTVTLSAGTTTTKAKTVAAGYPSDAPAGNIFVGRSGSANDVLNINFNGAGPNPTAVNIGWRFLLASAGGTTNATVNQSAGNTTVALNLAVSDSGNTSSAVYNLSGGTLTANSGLSRVGRRGDGKMFQTGGTATFNAGLGVGDDESTAVGETDDATGLYEISGGSLVTNLAGDALRVGSAGNGTLRVVGDDGIVDVNGNFLLGNTSDGVGNLAYRFETGDLLSTVDVSGTATLANGSGLSLDSSLAAPTQSTYNLLTAADVIDNGLLFATPGWTTQIVAGGNGEILQAVQTTPQYWDTDGATPGSGGASPSGNWDGTAANFTTDAAGASAATSAVTALLDDVVFAAGADGTGPYTVTVSGTQTAHAVQVARGDVTLTGGTLAVGTFDVASGASGTVASNVSGDAFGRVTKTGPGTLTLAAANAHAGGTTVNGGTLVLANADALGTGGLTVNNASAQAQAGLPKAVTAATVTLTGTGELDMTDNDLVIKTSTLAAVQAQITAGFNGGTWDGAGINSSSAATHPNATTALGYGDNAELGLTAFSGVALTGNEIIVKYTYYGDADLTGVVDLDDFGLFLTGYQNGSLPRTWIYGDFDYTGVIDLDDFGLFLYGYQNQGGALSALSEALAEASGISSSDRAAMQAAISAVPEPASLGILALAGAGLLGRRSRRRRHD